MQWLKAFLGCQSVMFISSGRFGSDRPIEDSLCVCCKAFRFCLTKDGAVSARLRARPSASLPREGGGRRNSLFDISAAGAASGVCAHALLTPVCVDTSQNCFRHATDARHTALKRSRSHAAQSARSRLQTERACVCFLGCNKGA